MKVLDSDFLVAVLRGFHEVRDKMKYLDLEKNATTTINAFELFYGAKRSENIKENVKLTKKLLNNLEIFGFCEKSADIASSIQSELMRDGKSIPLKDLFIASIALIHRCSVVTKNKKHFGLIEDLKVEGW